MASERALTKEKPWCLVGIDVGADELVVAIGERDEAIEMARFRHTPEGRLALREKLAALAEHFQVEVRVERTDVWGDLVAAAIEGVAQVRWVEPKAVGALRALTGTADKTDAKDAVLLRQVPIGRRRDPGSEPDGWAIEVGRTYDRMAWDLRRRVGIWALGLKVAYGVPPDALRTRRRRTLWLVTVAESADGRLRTGAAQTWIASHLSPRRAAEAEALLGEIVPYARGTGSPGCEARLSNRLAIEARQLLALEREVRGLEARLVDRSHTSPAALLVAGLPGLSQVRACRLTDEIGGIGRFETPAALAAYAGVAPRWRRKQSGRRDRRCRERGGNQYLRRLLLDAVQSVLRHDLRLRAFAQRLAARKKPTGLIKVACARRLVHAIWKALKTPK
jgi:transposase